MNPIRNDATAEASAVAVKIEPLSIPAALRILGLTARMYAIVIKVVSPARNSVRVLVPRS